MPRGVKNPPKSINEQLEIIDNKITGFQEKINELKSQKKALIESDRQEKLQSLLTTIEEKGLSIEDAVAKLAK